MKAKKVLLGLGLALVSNLASAQGLEGIVIEKFYQTNAADGVNAANNDAITPLNTGSTVYRVYVNMADGYKFSQLFGTAAHPLKVNTTTNFFNDPSSGSTTNPSAISTTNVRKNTALIDSWFTTGAVAAGKLGVLKSEDTDGSPGNAQGILQNNPGGAFGLPINIGNTASTSAADGMISGTVVEPNVLGISAAALNLFDQTTGNSFISTGGAIAALGGVVGPTASNMVLVGQFTTDGILTFELNVQLVNIATGVAENYVASNPTSGELTNPDLIFAPNVPPTVGITSPANNASIITGTNLTLAANSTDSDGTVTDVKFYVDGNLVGTDATAPYTASYTATAGAHTITAVSTDNDGDATTSSTVNISVANNQAPTISVVSSAASAVAGDVLTFTATAADVDGSVAQVEFFVDNVSIGVDNASPFSTTWTSTTGAHIVKAVATDDLSLTATSANVTVNIANNNPPTAAITAPLANATIIAPTVVTIEANATDTDGTVTQVEFLVNGQVVGTDNSAPYSYAWTSTPGAKTITVRSTDNKGATTTSSVLNLNIADPNALPYEVRTIDQKCILPKFEIPVAASATNTVNNVIGYDLVLNYDKTKMTPTGNITVNADMVDPALVNTSNSIDAVNGKMTISVYFTPQAPSTTKFAGNGKLISVEFNKQPAFASVDTANISVSFLQESYISGVQTKAVSAGKAITHKDYIYPMALRFWGNNQPIRYDQSLPNNHLISNVYGADVNTGVLNANNVAANPGVDGVVNYDLRNGLAVSVKRDIAGTTDVFDIVNAGDVSIVNSILLNDANVTPSVYQVIAADVNLDGVVSAGDISQIRQRGTLKIAEYRQAWNYDNAGVSNGEPSRDWIFIDSMTIKNDPAYAISSTYPTNDLAGGFSKSRVPVVPAVLNARVNDYTNCPVIIGETYKAVMLGDVDGTYAAQPNSGLLKSVSDVSDAKIVFDLTQAKKVGNYIDVPVSIESDNKFTGFDFALSLDNEDVKLNSILVNSGDVESFYHFNEDDKTVRFTSNNYDNFSTFNTVAVVRIEAQNSESLSTASFNPRMAMLNGKRTKVEVRQNAILTESFDLKLFPNPASEQVNVRVSEDAKLIITDLTGKEVVGSQDLKANTTKYVDVNELSSGVYLFKVVGNNTERVERVMIK
ncbi:MAG: T9SS type A sorting domain-containing protein [Crocinitomicaceae bacterium]|nr:T9SS type A sorting domain-containing protein [Crocinitomicaceae bacterium]